MIEVIDIFTAIGSAAAFCISIWSTRNIARVEGKQKRELETIEHQHQDHIENLKATLSHHLDEERARRAYEFDARKRLYQAVEPATFQLAELCETALGRILRFYASRGKLSEWMTNPDGYMVRSTVYMLMAPIAQFQIIRSQITAHDLRLAPRLHRTYLLAKQLFLTWSSDIALAQQFNIE